MRGSLCPVLAFCCCRERRDHEGADLQGDPEGVRTLMKVVPPGFRLCEWLRCCSDAGTVALSAYAMLSCSEELTVWCLLGRSTALSWLVACPILKEVGCVPPFLYHFVVTLSREFENVVLSEVKMGLQHFSPLRDPKIFSLQTMLKPVARICLWVLKIPPC